MPTWRTDDNTLINYEEHGASSSGGPQKEALLLLPGLLGSISVQWQPFLEPLSRRYHVVLMDLRGHGRSENAEMSLNPQRMVQDISGLLDALELDRVHIAGYSMGGYLGLMLALNEPQRVSTLLMHATKFYWTEKAVENTREQFDPDRMAEKVPVYADQLAREHGSRWRSLVRQAADLVAYLGKQGLTEEMVKRLQIPTLVSVGDRDELVVLPEAVRFSMLLPNGSLLVLPGVRHPFASITVNLLLTAMSNFHMDNARRR